MYRYITCILNHYALIHLSQPNGRIPKAAKTAPKKPAPTPVRGFKIWPMDGEGHPCLRHHYTIQSWGLSSFYSIILTSCHCKPKWCSQNRQKTVPPLEVDLVQGGPRIQL